MFSKGALKDSSVFVQLLILISMALLGLLLASFVGSIFIAMKFGISPEIMEEIRQNMMNYPDLLRNMQFFQVLGLFIFPAIICAWLFSDNYKNYLQIDTPVHLPVVILTVLSVLVAIPFLNFTYILNQQLVLPDWLKGLESWMMESEKAQGEILEKVLYAEHIGILLFNIVVICILTGIGEEFIFRGVLQNLFGKVMKNPHAIIWVVAIIFSFVHFQFYGFIPRMLLGAYLGYLLFYTKNMWMPVLAHFMNNCFSVVTYYIFQDSPEKMQQIDTIGTGSTWWLSVASFSLFVFLFWRIPRFYLK
jgi:membrane protease YdiL (CAAX protease family)